MLRVGLELHEVLALAQVDALGALERVRELVLLQRQRGALRFGGPHLGRDLVGLTDLDVVGDHHADDADLARLVLIERTPRDPHGELLGAIGLDGDIADGLVAVGDDDHARQEAIRVEAVRELHRGLRIGAGAAADVALDAGGERTVGDTHDLGLLGERDHLEVAFAFLLLDVVDVLLCRVELLLRDRVRNIDQHDRGDLALLGDPRRPRERDRDAGHHQRAKRGLHDLLEDREIRQRQHAQHEERGDDRGEVQPLWREQIDRPGAEPVDVDRGAVTDPVRDREPQTHGRADREPEPDQGAGGEQRFEGFAKCHVRR